MFGVKFSLVDWGVAAGLFVASLIVLDSIVDRCSNYVPTKDLTPFNCTLEGTSVIRTDSRCRSTFERMYTCEVKAVAHDKVHILEPTKMVCDPLADDECTRHMNILVGQKNTTTVCVQSDDGKKYVARWVYETNEICKECVYSWIVKIALLAILSATFKSCY